MKKAIFILLLLSLWIPYVQDNFEMFKLKPLSGTIAPAEKPVFSLIQWMEGNYQVIYGEYKEETFGLRNFFIRLYNQFDYSFFKKPHSEVTVGKDSYLFQDGYIEEVTGLNYLGEEAMRNHVKEMVVVENYLAAKNISLVTVLAPGKTDYYKEYLPEYYSDKLTNARNYTALLNFANRERISFIDLNKWFLQMKDTCKYPLFSRQGIHWNYYGMALSADTIVKYIESKNKINLADVSWTLQFPESLRGTDYDLGDLLNIMETLPFNRMPYPVFTILKDSTALRPRLLVIGDSFYWTIFNEGVFREIFSEETFFYYCSTISPENKFQSKITSDLNILKVIERYDIIVLLQSTANYGNPGVNFIQTVLNELNRRSGYGKKVRDVIATDQVFQKQLVKISDSLDISSDSSVSILIDSLVEVRFEEISKIKIQMRNNPQWLQQLYEKSNIWNKSIDQVMQTDAEWMVDQRNK